MRCTLSISSASDKSACPFSSLEFVADCVKLATGDRLRGQYHALSADPNSLANLDQDLPNSMQDQIPIFTLEQDWLWCQTWCDDESLATAKTSTPPHPLRTCSC